MDSYEVVIRTGAGHARRLRQDAEQVRLAGERAPASPARVRIAAALRHLAERLDPVREPARTARRGLA